MLCPGILSNFLLLLASCIFTAQLRTAREADLQAIRQLEATCEELRQELEARNHEVDQLTTLSLRGDATVQEYMANLKVGPGSS